MMANFFLWSRGGFSFQGRREPEGIDHPSQILGFKEFELVGHMPDLKVLSWYLRAYLLARKSATRPALSLKGLAPLVGG